jgi:hypothetical protein
MEETTALIEVSRRDLTAWESCSLERDVEKSTALIEEFTALIEAFTA